MSLEKWFIHGDGFHADRIVHRDQLGDLIDQEHRIAMRQDFHDFFYVEFHKCFLLENDGVLIDNMTIARRQRVPPRIEEGIHYYFFRACSFSDSSAFSLWLPRTAMMCASSGPTREMSPKISKIL